LVRPVVVFIAFGVVVLLVAVGISRLTPIDQLRPTLGDEATQPPKRSDRFSEQPIELPEPFKSLVLDAAKSYLVTERSPLATLGPLAKPDLTPR
jgi:hypothetical protein